jgi:hypothetical protein
MVSSMGLLLRLAPFSLILFASAAHAQSKAEFPPPATAAPSEAEPPVVTAAPSVNSAPRRADPVPLPPAAPPESSPSERTRWYGLEILTADAGALALLAGAALAANHNDGLAGSLAIGSLATYEVGGPIVHALHGNWGRAIGSGALRAGAPIVGALLGVASEDCTGGDFCGIEGGVIGFAVGVGTAIILDSALIAHEPAHDAPPPVLPVVATSKNGTWLGLSGSF